MDAEARSLLWSPSAARQHFDDGREITIDLPEVPHFQGHSTYKEDYPAHPLEERQLRAPAVALGKPLPFEGQSAYKDEYKPHALEVRPAAAPARERAPAPPFEGSSSYAENFRPYPIQRAEPVKPPTYRGPTTKFEGTSENHEAFKAWAIDPNNYRGQAPPPMRASLPFEGTTTNRELFKGWQLPPRRPALGVQMFCSRRKHNVAFVLIPANAPVPACGRQVFTTVHDGQTEMDVLVLEGADLGQASMGNVLGQITISGIQPAPRAVAKMEVIMRVDANGVLNVTATDLCNKRQEHWLREGWLTAHV